MKIPGGLCFGLSSCTGLAQIRLKINMASLMLKFLFTKPTLSYLTDL